MQVFDVILEQLTLAVAQQPPEQDVPAILQNREIANQQYEEQSYEEYMDFSTKLSSGMIKGIVSI